MILTGSGQNINPEGIEDMINSLPMLVESLFINRKLAIVALVVILITEYMTIKGHLAVSFYCHIFCLFTCSSCNVALSA
jgi:long-subunit acyl-CoA synthetase (AMP-forming)